MFRIRFSFLLILLLLFSALADAADLKILAPPESQAPAYTVAAQELQKYYEMVTGVKLEIVRESNDSDNYLIIGSDAVNPFVRQLVERKVIVDFPLKTASDNFRLLTVKDGERTHLILAGGRGRSTLYAVYCLLEQRAGCRWFWDGDVVPKQSAIDITGLDVQEAPRFEYRGQRYFAHRGLWRFQAEHWALPDWQKEIDWLLKKRLNIFMLRIGMDDLFQKAFPDIVDYPDPSKPLPEALNGYDNRSLFWPLQFRGQLRKDLLAYAFERDLMHPEDFGTMSHWYSRTPYQFLKAEKPKFVPNYSGYGHETDLVWDIREDKNLENYWKLTQAHIDNYGSPQLFHTIGIAERHCYKDREDNLRMKLYAYRRLIDNLRKHYPEAQLLLAGWDFYNSWTPEECREFFSQLDPNRTILWDYEAEADGNRNFTNWGVVGKFPYVFGVFQAYESAMDIRGNYPKIEKRMEVAINDPFCRGYILWPENSHSDIFMLHYFTSNAWRPGVKSTDELLTEFCKDRYGDQADAMAEIWRQVHPISQMLDWWGNFWSQMNATINGARKPQDAAIWRNTANDQQPKLKPSIDIFKRLANVQWSDPFVRRDSIDLGRTTMDRLITCSRVSLFAAMNDWREGKADAQVVRRKVEAFRQLGAVMRDMLALHEDYSIYETVVQLNKTCKIENPEFDKVILDNASCGYCQSHQYELMNTWYLPCFNVIADWAIDRLDRDDKSEFTYPEQFKKTGQAAYAKMMATPLADQKPTLDRTPENYRNVMERACAAAKQIFDVQ